MQRFNLYLMLAYALLLLFAASTHVARAAPPIYADGDVGPLGAPDGLIDIADQLILNRILSGQVTPGALEYAHGDVYPVGAPDGVIDVRDLLLIQRQAVGQGAGNFVENLDLFLDGPATFTVDVNGTIGSTDLVVGGFSGAGATLINDPNYVDPADAGNTVWRVSVSGGVGNVFMGTEDLSSDPVLDSGFDLSGPGGQLVFDIKVNSISPGAVLTVKIDSGYPALGQVALTPAQYTVGSWRRVVIDFATLLADPGPGPGLDLDNVVNAFLIEVTGGDADFYLDNIFVTHACAAVDACNATVNTQVFVPLYDGTTVLEPALQEDTPAALITRLSDRARDRHAREDQFQIYDHYLSHYWEHRTAAIEIVDTIGKGGNTITFNVTTEWQLSPTEAELRFFYRGIGTVAEYYNNGVMTSVPGLDVPGEDARHYTRSLSYNQKFNRPLQVGDRLEFELSQFLDAVPNGRNNYYGTAILYIVGQGVVPWEARGVFGDPATEREDSYPMPVAGWLGGNTTLPYQYSDEPDKHFMQMAGNLSHINGQVFVLGRRVHHTDFGDGSHDEPVNNPPFAELANKLGPNYINDSCIACHTRNGRALPPAVGQPLEQYVVRVGDTAGNPHAQLGAVLQPEFTSGAAEGGVTLSGWNESNGLRSPNFSFTGVTPEYFSARIAPQLVGMGLLEAIADADIEAGADPFDADGDGISGRMRLVTDTETGETRIGRFGWKATQPRLRHQVAAAFNTDMGVMTSVLPSPDCGAQQSNCGAVGSELSDEHLDNLSAYIALLGVSARRDLDDPVALQGESLFNSAGCNGCHTDTFQTSPHHPHAELRDQTIHPYTDLLLHDMGPGLASTLVEGNAAGAEWRTPPLWNIGLTAGVSAGEAYLHDGRARSLHEAIMWHGGEAETSRQNYDAMSQSDKHALIAFLQSL